MTLLKLSVLRLIVAALEKSGLLDNPDAPEEIYLGVIRYDDGGNDRYFRVDVIETTADDYYASVEARSEDAGLPSEQWPPDAVDALRLENASPLVLNRIAEIFENDEVPD